MRSVSATVREQGTPASSKPAPGLGPTEATITGTEPGPAAPAPARNVSHKQGGRVPKRKGPLERSGQAAKKVNAAEISATPPQEITTNVAISLSSQFSQTIVIPAALDALFGMTPEERVAEVMRLCERNEVEALNRYVAPLTRWLNDLDYILDNYADVVDALENHFNKPGRPDGKRARWSDLGFDASMLSYIDQKFGYKPEMPIVWAGICHVFFNRTIRTMQRRKAYKSMLTSGETLVPPKKPRKEPEPKSNIDPAEFEDVKKVALLGVKWASESPESSYAQAIMKLAGDRAKHLGQDGLALVAQTPSKDDPQKIAESIHTPRALWSEINKSSTWIDALDNVFMVESEAEFGARVQEFAQYIADGFRKGFKVEVHVGAKEEDGK